MVRGNAGLALEPCAGLWRDCEKDSSGEGFTLTTPATRWLSVSSYLLPSYQTLRRMSKDFLTSFELGQCQGRTYPQTIGDALRPITDIVRQQLADLGQELFRNLVDRANPIAAI